MTLCVWGGEEVIKEDVLGGGTKQFTGVFRVVAEKQHLYFEFGRDERNLAVFVEDMDATILSVEKAGGFVGTVIGMYAVNGCDESKGKFFADFDWFRYVSTCKGFKFGFHHGFVPPVCIL